MNDTKKEKIFKNKLFVMAAALLCCALWGSATPFIKIGYELVLPAKDTASTILFAGIRFALAGIITVVIYSVARRRFLYPKRENLGRVAVVAVFQTIIQYIFFYIGLANTTGVKGTIASGSNAFFALLVAGLVFRTEKLTLKKLFACIIGFAGIIPVNLNGLDFTMNFTGDGFVIFSAIAYAFSSVLIKLFSKCENPVIISGYQFILGGVVMTVLGASLGGHVVFESVKAVAVLLYLALLSAIAYSVWGVLLKYNPVSEVSIYSFMIPVFGVLLSSVMLREQGNVPPVMMLASLILISLGIILLNCKKKG